MRIAVLASSALSAVALMSMLLAIGCEASVDADVTADELRSSNTRVLLAPESEATRVSCREAAQVVYCDAASARAAIAKCAGNPAEVVTDVRPGACKPGQRVYPSPASCKQPVEYNCAFYAGCVERSYACGNSGYALGFGERYCTAFRTSGLSPAGMAWMRSTMGCLQKALVPEVAPAFSSAAAAPATCNASMDRAFASHPACYTSPSNSVCFLPVSDLSKILGTIGLGELLTPRTSGQSLSTAGICAKQLVDRIFGGFRFPTGTKIAANESAPEQALQAASAELSGANLNATQLEALRQFWDAQVQAESTR